MAFNFNQSPYYDDAQDEKSFYKILFKPSLGVQARELNQLQSLINRQIDIYGKHVFKEGSMVIPGNTSIDTSASYVRLNTTSNVLDYIGLDIVGVVSGVKARIVYAINREGTDSPTIYVKYLSSGNNNTTKEFVFGEAIQVESNSLVIGSVESDGTGVGSIASIESGWYFIKGFFVQVLSQTIILDKYSNTPTYKVGLNAIEDITTSDEDESLLDNAQGSPNFAAPGADRYTIKLQFAKISLTEERENTEFIQLIVVEDGVVKQKIDNSEYSILEKTLARRTYDESGDYTVKPFQIDVREYRNNFRGNWSADTQYLANDVVLHNGRYYQTRLDGTSNQTPPTHTIATSSTASTGVAWTYESNPFFNRGVYSVVAGESSTTQNKNKSKLAIGLEAGKAYVRGYEIEKIATEYIPVEKARSSLDQTNIRIPAVVGNFIIAKNLNGLPDISTYSIVSLYDRYTTSRGNPSGTKIGTCRVRYIEYDDGVAGTNATTYKISVFDISMNEGKVFNRDVKQLYWFNDGSAVTSFSCDIDPMYGRTSGSISTSGTTVNGLGTLFLSEYKVGDYFTSGNQTRRVVTITSNTIMTVDSAFSPMLSGELQYRNETAIFETENNALLFPLPYPFVKSVRDSDNVNNTIYTKFKEFQQTSVVVGSTSTVTISVSGNDTFSSPSLVGNYLLYNRTTGNVVNPLSIDLVTPQQAVITISNNSVASYDIICGVNVSGISGEKIKSLLTQTHTVTNKNIVTATKINLPKADGYRLLAVYMDTGTFESPTGTYGIDITDRYTFSTGQTVTHYGLASIVLSQSAPAPTSNIQVTFEYFAHSGSGDHFTINSYLSTISYEEIPTFFNVSLGDVIDFRPRIADDGISFVTSGGIPRRGLDIITDFSHYTGRIDKVILNQDGSFFDLVGSADINPVEPSSTSTGVVLYKLNISPYTSSTYAVNVEFIDNKRYTMRDIGKLERRINNVEYYTSLSMLEQDAQSLEIQDELGLNRFKNGFIVDNFTGHNIGSVTSIDYICSIDMANGHLRPFFYMDNINLIEENSNDTQRTFDGYQVTGDLVTLPYTEVPMIQQLDASRVENINPFAIFTFIGSADLNPPSDEWFETNRLPDIINNVDGNFNSIYATAEAQGVLGTVWNAWQTQWTGASTVLGRKSYSTGSTWAGRFGDEYLNLNEFNARFGVSNTGGSLQNLIARQVVVETSATTVTESRNGIRTVVVPKITNEVTDDRVVSRAVIPYIRARWLLFTVRGLKPSTKFNTFFDEVNVSDYVMPSSVMVVSKRDGFDYTSRAGGDATETARSVDGTVEAGLDKGDVIFVKSRNGIIYTKTTAPATAILALDANSPSSNGTALHLVNLQGSFQVGDIIEGSISGESSTVLTPPTTYNFGDDLISSSIGDAIGIFRIPNTNSIRFRTGVREFKLSDSLIDESRTSFTRKQYRAEGILETKQASITSTRNAEVRTEAVNENRTIVQESSRVVSDTGWYDPLAQTFLVDSRGGAFITSVDIWFATKDENIPARMEIREVVNGYPGKLILPFSKVTVDASDVKLSDTMVKSATGEYYPAPDRPTNFKFSSPVYLNDKTEYCIVLLSDSNNYKVWITQLGDISVITGNVISEQPYAGVLFKSQNASTWTADQNQDLMFRINKAKFTVGQYGETDYINTNIPKYELLDNPLSFVKDKNYIRVQHENHCMFAGAKVTLSGATTGAGIPLNQINTTHTILADSLEYDSYIIQVASNATTSGSYGGVGMIASEYIEFTTIQPIVQQQVFPETELTYFYKGRTGQSVDGNEVPYVSGNYTSISANENNDLSIINLVANREAEVEFMGGDKSIRVRSRMITHNENISPVIDLTRLSVITVQDKINSPTEQSVNFEPLDKRNVVTGNTLISIDANGLISTTDTTTKLAFLSMDIGQYINVSGFTAPTNNGKFMILDIGEFGDYIKVDNITTVQAVGGSITIDAFDRYLDEISPLGSSSVAKYVSKKINLKLPSEFIRVKFSASVEESSDVTLYYKTDTSGSTSDFNNSPYVMATPSRRVVKANDGVFYDVEYSIEGLTPFTSVQVKIVMNSDYIAHIPKIKDLTVICCA
jgi:hypothetical protein